MFQRKGCELESRQEESDLQHTVCSSWDIDLFVQVTPSLEQRWLHFWSAASLSLVFALSVFPCVSKYLPSKISWVPYRMILGCFRHIWFFFGPVLDHSCLFHGSPLDFRHHTLSPGRWLAYRLSACHSWVELMMLLYNTHLPKQSCAKLWSHRHGFDTPVFLHMSSSFFAGFRLRWRMLWELMLKPLCQECACLIVDSLRDFDFQLNRVPFSQHSLHATMTWVPEDEAYLKAMYLPLWIVVVKDVKVRMRFVSRVSGISHGTGLTGLTLKPLSWWKWRK